MKNICNIAILALASFTAAANGASDLRGGACFWAGPRSKINCDHIGHVDSIKEIYEKKFKVVNMMYIPPGNGTSFVSGIHITIEEVK